MAISLTNTDTPPHSILSVPTAPFEAELHLSQKKKYWDCHKYIFKIAEERKMTSNGPNFQVSFEGMRSQIDQ